MLGLKSSNLAPYASGFGTERFSSLLLSLDFDQSQTGQERVLLPYRLRFHCSCSMLVSKPKTESPWILEEKLIRVGNDVIHISLVLT